MPVMDPQPNPSVAAPSPFDRKDADVIIRSSDRVDFHVHRYALIIASPVFEARFQCPQPTDQVDLQVIDVTENRCMLEMLLRILYPIVDPVVDVFEHAHELLKAALKYDMAVAVVFAERSLACFIQKQPLRVYAVACQNGLEALASIAAREAVTQKVVDNMYIAEYEELPAGCYHRLLQYQRHGVDNATSFIVCCADTSIFPPDERKEHPTHQLERDAPYPFDNPDADTTIVSSDQVRFRVHEIIIKLASPTLKSMLETLRSPHDVREAEGGEGTMSILQVDDDSKILHPLLSLCYPSSHPEPVHIDSLPLLLAAAKKYKMERATWFLLQHWSDFAMAYPLRSYLFASSYGWKDQALCSARMTLALEDLQTHYEVGLETTATGPYYYLLQYHRECSNIAKQLALRENIRVSNLTRTMENEMSKMGGKKKKKGKKSIYDGHYERPVVVDSDLESCSALICFGLQVEDIGKLSSTLPSTRDDFLVEAVHSISECSHCGKRTGSIISSFHAFEHTLGDEIAKVDLKTLFQEPR